VWGEAVAAPGAVRGIDVEGNADEMALLLSGVAVRDGGRVRVYNRIYREVFNLEWAEKEQAKLRPYQEKFETWKLSRDHTFLLEEEDLLNAKIWAQEKKLDALDYEFISASSRKIDLIKIGNLTKPYGIFSKMGAWSFFGHHPSLLLLEISELQRAQEWIQKQEFPEIFNQEQEFICLSIQELNKNKIFKQTSLVIIGSWFNFFYGIYIFSSAIYEDRRAILRSIFVVSLILLLGSVISEELDKAGFALVSKKQEKQYFIAKNIFQISESINPFSRDFMKNSHCLDMGIGIKKGNIQKERGDENSLYNTTFSLYMDYCFLENPQVKNHFLKELP
jgi:hypothetical protein